MQQIKQLLGQCQGLANDRQEYINQLEDDLFEARALVEEQALQISELESLLATADLPPTDTSVYGKGVLSPTTAWPPQHISSTLMYTDPSYGTLIRRIGTRHVYSQLQPWNDDETWVILSGGILFSFDIDSAGVIEDTGVSLSAPRWWGNKIVEVDEGSISVDFHTVSFVDGILRAQSYEQPSGDGRLAVYAGGAAYVVDLSTGGHSAYDVDSLYSDGAEIVNWVRALGGDMFAIQFSDGGTHFYDRGAHIDTVDNHRHSDVLGGGYIYNSWPSSGRQQALVVRSIGGGLADEVLYRHDAWGRAESISGTGPRVVVTAGHQYGDDPLKGTIWTPENGQARALAHHRSSMSSYESQPHAAMSPSGRYVAFASDMSGEVAGYVIDLGPQ